MAKQSLIRKIYLYLFSLIGLVLVVVGVVRLIGLGLKVYVFTKADQLYSYPQPRAIVPMPPEKSGEALERPSQAETDEFNKNQLSSTRQREAAESLAMIVVGLPLYFYHWRVIRKDKETI